MGELHNLPTTQTAVAPNLPEWVSFPGYDRGHDAVSGLLDKERWHERLEKEVKCARAASSPVGVTFIDINAFKLVNDQLGHPTGDEVIEDVGLLVNDVASNLLSQNGRPDLAVKVSYSFPSEARAGRIGGDEFGIIAIGADQHGMEALEQRVRSSFESYMERPEQVRLRKLGVGLAIGSSSLKEDMTASDLLTAADKAMYEDKKRQLPELTPEQQEIINFVENALVTTGWRRRELIRHLINGED